MPPWSPPPPAQAVPAVRPPANVVVVASRASVFRLPLLFLEPNVPSPFRDSSADVHPTPGGVGQENKSRPNTSHARPSTNVDIGFVSVIHLLCNHGFGRVGLDIFPEGCGYEKGTPKGPLRRRVI